MTKREIAPCTMNGKQYLKSTFAAHLIENHHSNPSEQELERSIDSLLILFELLTKIDKNIKHDSQI